MSGQESCLFILIFIIRCFVSINIIFIVIFNCIMIRRVFWINCAITILTDICIIIVVIVCFPVELIIISFHPFQFIDLGCPVFQTYVSLLPRNLCYIFQLSLLFLSFLLLGVTFFIAANFLSFFVFQSIFPICNLWFSMFSIFFYVFTFSFMTQIIEIGWNKIDVSSFQFLIG